MLKAVSLQLDGRLSVNEFSAQSGEITVILGSNGSGKSTLISILANLEKPEGSSLTFNGLDLQQLSPQAHAQTVAVLTQRQGLEFDFTVEEVIRMGLHPLQLDPLESQERFDQLVQALDLGGLLTRPYPTLSRGEAQRTQIARVLIQRSVAPGLIMLDEPLTALDLRHQEHAMQLFKTLCNDGHTLVLVLHDLDIAARFADRFALMFEGELLALGGLDVLTEPLLGRVYEIPIRRTEAPDGSLQFNAVIIND